MTRLLPCITFTLLVITACDAQRDPAPLPEPAEPSTVTGIETEQLHQVFTEFWEEYLVLDPVFATYIGDNRFNDKFANDISPDWIARAQALERRYLVEIRKIDPNLLQGQDRLSYDIFIYNRDTTIKGFKYPEELLPVNQFSSIPNFFATMGSGKSVHPFATVKDYEDWLARIDGFVEWMDQAIVNMREGMRRGIVQPRVLMEQTLPQLSAHVKERAEDTVFWGPVLNFPATFSNADKMRLTDEYHNAITQKLILVYHRLHDFIKYEYLPHTRETIGLDALPDGENWYAYLVRRTTTTDLSPEQIHNIGLQEVGRIHNEMRGVMRAVNYSGDLKDFFKYMNEDPQFYFSEKEQLLDGYRTMKNRINALVPRLFDVMPKADYEIRAVEAFREKSASGASYLGASPDGTRPGIFYVNTYDLSARPNWAIESLSLHEAAPGHHFQGSLTLELADLPAFRRFGSYTAYGEGWGLYAESLGKELGVYTDPYQYFGALNAELWRAIRLVVDTGLHYKGWTRQRVLDYMYANSAAKPARAVSEAERYIAIPSQALAYKVGQLKISGLRDLAQGELGKRFDLRQFHNQVLLDGELPLDTLEKKIRRWITASKTD